MCNLFCQGGVGRDRKIIHILGYLLSFFLLYSFQMAWLLPLERVTGLGSGTVFWGELLTCWSESLFVIVRAEARTLAQLHMGGTNDERDMKWQIQGYTAESYNQSSSFSASLSLCSWLCFLCFFSFQLLHHSLPSLISQLGHASLHYLQFVGLLVKSMESSLQPPPTLCALPGPMHLPSQSPLVNLCGHVAKIVSEMFILRAVPDPSPPSYWRYSLNESQTKYIFSLKSAFPNIVRI